MEQQQQKNATAVNMHGFVWTFVYALYNSSSHWLDIPERLSKPGLQQSSAGASNGVVEQPVEGATLRAVRPVLEDLQVAQTRGWQL